MFPYVLFPNQEDFQCSRSRNVVVSPAADRARLLFGTNSSQVEEAGKHSRGVSRLVVHHKYDLKGEHHIFSLL